MSQIPQTEYGVPELSPQEMDRFKPIPGRTCHTKPNRTKGPSRHTGIPRFYQSGDTPIWRSIKKPLEDLRGCTRSGRPTPLYPARGLPREIIHWSSPGGWRGRVTCSIGEVRLGPPMANSSPPYVVLVFGHTSCTLGSLSGHISTPCTR